MKLAITTRFSTHAGLDMEPIFEAERLGFHTVWAGEAWGSDAVSPVAWILAQTKRIKAGTGILQMPARTPAMAASGTTVAHEPMTAVVVATAHRIETRCSIMPTSFDWE